MSLSDALTNAKRNAKNLSGLTESELSYVFERAKGTVTVTTPNATQSELKNIEKYLSSYEYINEIVNQNDPISIVDDITETIISALLGRKPIKEPSTSPLVTIKAPTTSKINVKTNTQQVRTTKGLFYSLTNLLTLLNKRLPETVAKNMGKGAAVNTLNFRTGRFSHSVFITRLLVNKDASITAFYNYMKYPYETFAPGFKQGSNKNRDPNILIRKSIREEAAGIITNKLLVKPEEGTGIAFQERSTIRERAQTIFSLKFRKMLSHE